MYIIKTKEDYFVHTDGGYIVLWHNINPAAIVMFDTYDEAEEYAEEYEFEDYKIVKENIGYCD